jgi:hypothetical protein
MENSLGNQGLKSSVNKGTGYRLDGRGLIPDRDKKISPLRIVHIVSWDHPVSYTMDTVGSHQGGEAPGA